MRFLITVLVLALIGFLIAAFINGFVAAAGAASAVAPIEAPAVDAAAVTPDLTGVLVSLVQKAPWIFTLLTVIGALRLLVKPAFAAAHYIAERTETPKDDELIARIENSKVLRTFCFVLDWVASVKLRK